MGSAHTIMHLRLRPILVASLMVGGFISSGSMGGEPILEEANLTVPIVSRILPQRTLAVAIFEDLASTSERLKSTSPWQLWSEPQVQEFLGPIVPVLARIASSAEGKVEGLRLDDLTSAFRGQIALALVDIKLTTDVGKPLPELALLAEVTDREAASRLLAIFKRSAAGANGPELRTWTVGPLEFAQMEIEEGLEFGYVLSPDALYAAIGPGGDILKELVTTATGKTPSDTLATDTAFLQVIKRSGALKRDVLGYVNVSRVFEIGLRSIAVAEPIEAAMARSVLFNLGLLDIASLSLVERVWWNGIQDEFFMHVPAPRKGLFRLVSDDPLSKDLLALAPGTSRGLVALRMNPDALLAIVRDMASSISPNSVDQIDAAIGNVNAAIGIDLQQQVLRGLGGEGAVILPESSFLFAHRGHSAMAGLAEAAVVLKVANAEAFRPVYDKLMAIGSSLTLESGNTIEDFVAPCGTRVRYLTLPLGFTPSVALSEQFLVFAPTKEGVLKILAAASTGIDTFAKGIYQPLSECVGRKKGFWFAYAAPLRAEELAPLLASAPVAIAGLYAGAAADEDAPRELRELLAAINLPKLPAAAVITKHCGPFIQVGWTDDQGIGLTSWGSGLGAAQIASAAIMAAVVVPQLIKSPLPVMRNTGTRPPVIGND